MAGTLLGFGLFALVAAVVGGGLKAFGFELGALTSRRRQGALAAIGAILIVVSQWHDYIQPLLLRSKSGENGLIQLRPGENHNFSLTLKHAVPVDFFIESIVPDPNWHDPKATSPELYVRVCAGTSAGCEGQQVGANGAARRDLAAGPVTISVFNFFQNPAVSFASRTSFSD